MTLFWMVTAIMLILAVMVTATALLRPVIRNNSTGDTENAEIARERLEQVRQSHHRGELSDAEFAQAVSEIEAILAEELASQARSQLSGNPFGQAALIGVVLFLPALTYVTYSTVGSPNMIVKQAVVQQQSVAQQQQPRAQKQPASGESPSLPELVDKLSARMQAEPDNAEGWFMLGRSQMALNRYQDAVTSFRQVDRLVPNTAPVLLALANAVAMAQGGKIGGEPETLVLQALQNEPNDPVGLWLAGNAREEAGDYPAAIDFWQRAVPLLQDNPDDQKELIGRMQMLASQAGIKLQPMPASPQAKSLIVSVSLDPAVADGLTGNETLFIFARAVSGPPMPLAASRHSVSELPLEIELNDDMAMMPAMKLSAFDEVKVSAKISSSGNATPDPSDLVSAVVLANPGQNEPIQLIVNQRRQ